MPGVPKEALEASKDIWQPSRPYLDSEDEEEQDLGATTSLIKD